MNTNSSENENGYTIKGLITDVFELEDDGFTEVFGR